MVSNDVNRWQTDFWPPSYWPIIFPTMSPLFSQMSPLFSQMSPLFQEPWDIVPSYEISRQNTAHRTISPRQLGAPVAQWVKRWPTDLADRVRSSLEVKSSQPLTKFHCTQPFIIILTLSWHDRNTVKKDVRSQVILPSKTVLMKYHTIKTYIVTPSLEPSHRDGSNEGSQCKILLRNKKNYLWIILITPSYLELWPMHNDHYWLYLCGWVSYQDLYLQTISCGTSPAVLWSRKLEFPQIIPHQLDIPFDVLLSWSISKKALQYLFGYKIMDIFLPKQSKRSTSTLYEDLDLWGLFRKGKSRTRKSGVLGSIPGLATYFRFSFRFFKKGSCQLLVKVCAKSTG